MAEIYAVTGQIRYPWRARWEGGNKTTPPTGCEPCGGLNKCSITYPYKPHTVLN